MTGIVGNVTASSGSKGVKHKNIRDLAGKPLMAYCIEAAKKAHLLDRVILTTDTEQYAAIGRQYGAETPFLRPPMLSHDIPSERVVLHAVHWLESHKYPVKVAVTLQPTTPLVRPEDIDGCVKMLLDHEAESAITVTEARTSPLWMFYRYEDGGMEPYVAGDMSGKRGIRQQLKTLYRPNGAAYATDRDYLLRKHRIIGDRCYGVVMPELLSYDIDTEADFAVLEAIMGKMREDLNLS